MLIFHRWTPSFHPGHGAWYTLLRTFIPFGILSRGRLRWTLFTTSTASPGWGWWYTTVTRWRWWWCIGIVDFVQEGRDRLAITHVYNFTMRLVCFRLAVFGEGTCLELPTRTRYAGRFVHDSYCSFVCWWCCCSVTMRSLKLWRELFDRLLPNNGKWAAWMALRKSEVARWIRTHKCDCRSLCHTCLNVIHYYPSECTKIRNRFSSNGHRASVLFFRAHPHCK